MKVFIWSWNRNGSWDRVISIAENVEQARKLALAEEYISDELIKLVANKKPTRIRELPCVIHDIY